MSRVTAQGPGSHSCVVAGLSPVIKVKCYSTTEAPVSTFFEVAYLGGLA